MAASEACGQLESSLDIVNGLNYLQSVKVDHDDLTAAMECNCDRLLKVIAEVDSDELLSNEFYGQLDVREPESGIITVTDSVEYIFDRPVTTL